MNLQILVTRPAHQAQSFCEAIRLWGGEALLFPTVEIVEPKNKSALLAAIKNLTQFDLVIFTSANAVNKTMMLQPEINPSLPVIAIGSTTAQALMQYHIKVEALPEQAFNSESLLKLPLLQQVNGKNIGIFTGEEGRTLLAETLKQRGAHVIMAYAYRRQLPQIPPEIMAKWHKKHFDLIVCTSKEILQNLMILWKDFAAQLLAIPLLVISEGMQIYAKQLGFREIILAPNATDKAVLDTIKTWYSTSRK